MPSPPSFFGGHTISQFTLHLAPMVVLFVDQRKAFKILFMKLKVPDETPRDVK
jgi:hypothetical protein